MPSERRILGLDIGERRIGVAVSDAEGRLATPLTTIAARPLEQAFRHLARLVEEYAVSEVVVGLPLTLRGEIGPQAQVVQQVAQQLKARLGLPVHLFDERLTTAAAEQTLRELGVKPEKRKQRVDQIAAALILQDFLDRRGADPEKG